MSATIYDSLPEGRENGIRAEQIMLAHGITSKRQLSQIIRHERMKHLPILQINGYYFRSNKREDYLSCIHSLQERSIKTMQVSRLLYSMAPEERAEAPEGYKQMTFDEYMQLLEAEQAQE